MGRRGYSIDTLVTLNTGSPAPGCDVVWRRGEDLPSSDLDVEGEQAYRVHLAGQAARRPASEVTTFLLGAAVAGDAGR